MAAVLTLPPTATGRVLRNTASNVAGRGVVVLTWFALTPFVLDRLGPAGYGLWVLAGVAASYGSLLDLGMGSAVVKVVAELEALDDAAGRRRLVGTTVRLYAGLAAAGLLLGLAFAVLVAPRAFAAAGADPTTVVQVFALMSVTLAVTLAGTPATAALRGLQRYDVSNAISVGAALATAALTVAVLSAGGGVTALVAAGVPVAVAGQVAAAVALRVLSPAHALHWSPGDRATAGRLLRLGSTMLVGQAAGLLQKRTDEVVIGAALGLAAVAPYAVARRLSDVAHVLTEQFVKVLLPVASALDARGEQERLRSLYLASTRVTLALALPTACVAALLSADLLEVWLGPEYRRYAHLVVLLLAAGVALTWQWPAGSVFQGTGRFGALAVAAVVSGIANLALSVALVGPLGLTGVALGTLVPTVAETALFVLPLAARRLGVPARALWRQAVRPAALPLLPCAAVVLLLQQRAGDPSWPGLLLTAGLALAGYAAAELAFPVAAPERRAAAAAAALVSRPVRRALARPAAPAPADRRPGRLVVVTALNDRGTSGVATHIRAVTSAAQRRGVDVVVVAPASRWAPAAYAVMAVRRVVRRVDSEQGVRWYRAARRRLLVAAVRAELRRPGPVSALYAQSPTAADAALRARGTTGVPVVMAVHYNLSEADEWVGQGELRDGSGTTDRVRREDEQVLSRLDGLVFVSDFMRRHVRAAVPRTAAVPALVVPNFLPWPGPAAGDRPVLGDCISVGALEPRKNQEHLLRVLAAAARRGHRPSLTLVGDGPDRRRLERLAADLGVSGQVRFAGRRDDVDELLAQHRVYLHAALVENCPFAILEAMRAGLPVLAPAVGGIPDVVGADPRDGWPLDDPEAAADRLLALLADPCRAAALGRRAAGRFRDRFSEDAVADRLLEFLTTAGGARTSRCRQAQTSP